MILSVLFLTIISMLKSVNGDSVKESGIFVSHNWSDSTVENCLILHDKPCLLPVSHNDVYYDANTFYYGDLHAAGDLHANSASSSTSGGIIAIMHTNFVDEGTNFVTGIDTSQGKLQIFIDTMSNILWSDRAYYSIINDNFVSCTTKWGCCTGNPCMTGDNIIYYWNFLMNIYEIVDDSQINNTQVLDLTFYPTNKTYGSIEYQIQGPFDGDYFSLNLIPLKGIK